MGSDAPFHLARIESLNQALQMGIFPVKVHPSLAYSYGYGVGIFYPRFFYLSAGSFENGRMFAGSFL